jgi:perosamine synthetase
VPISATRADGASDKLSGSHFEPVRASGGEAAATLAYNTFDPAPCDFPPSRVPVLPALTAGALWPGSRSEFMPIGAGSAKRRYTHGRYALHDAYRLAGVGPSEALLAPAYHCRTMIDAAIALGAPVLLYGLSPELRIDIPVLAQLVESSRVPVRALLLTHYFGFAQPAASIREFCDAHGIVLIEDCAHALFVSRRAPQFGRSGRYVIASPYKMFPCNEGGLLLAAADELLPPTRQAGLRRECRTLLHAYQGHSAWRGARRRTAIDRLDADIASIAGGAMPPGRQSHARLPGTSHMYDPSEEGRACSRAATAIASLCNIEHIAQRRRANYRRWSDAVRALPHCRPLFADLPDDCVPYMFPLLIDQPQTHFYVLKKLGMPIWRWDDMAESSCAVSQHYREHLLHLPCHQALSDEELTWMTSAVTKVMRLAQRNA